MEYLSALETKLDPDIKVICIHEGKLNQGESKILALIDKSGEEHAFIILKANGSDIEIERVLPIDNDFCCEIDIESKNQNFVDVKISSRKNEFLISMMQVVRTQNLVDEIYRAVELYSKRKGPPSNFSWLSKYKENPTTELFDTRPRIDIKPPETFTINYPHTTMGAIRNNVSTRERTITERMTSKQDEYLCSKEFRIFIGTYNVNGQMPSVPLEEWLACDEEPPDIYAIGFQELDLSKEAFLFNDTPREQEWWLAVTKALHPKAKYQNIKLVRLVGIMLIVYCKQQYCEYIKNLAIDTVGTGIMGKMGNKGGVAVRFDFHNTSMCFVNSHLAAHVEEFERRNQDYRDICSRLNFQSFRTIKSHDQVYWLGDLNYRITDMDVQYVKDMIAKNEFDEILEYDQLKLQHAKKTVFEGYFEGPINFKPTYKYDPYTDEWDSSEKNRAPAWCDRVLWTGNGIKQIDYRSHPGLKISDHKPVSAVFISQVRVIDPVKYRKVHEQVMKTVDKQENDCLPQVMVDKTEIIFDTVKYLEAQKRELIIANTGSVPVVFKFINKLEDPSFCKPWLTIEPSTQMIKPGEKCDVFLEVFVDKKTAFKLNSGEQLYDILVLHLEGGKDIFITITASYERSCFGMSIEALAHIFVPIRELPAGKLLEYESGTYKESPTGQDPHPVPKEIWFLVDHLYTCGLRQARLFENPGLTSEVIKIRDWLDEGSSEPIPGSVYSVAEALILLLESTAEPLIPYNLHEKCLNASSNYLQCKKIVFEQLPEYRKNVFIYFCVFLQEVIKFSKENGVDAKTLATLFGGIFFREPPRRANKAQYNQPQANDRKKANFVYQFLVNSFDD